MKSILQRLRQLVRATSADYALTEEPTATEGWRDRTIALRQRAAYEELLRDLRNGAPRLDLVIAANAIRESGIAGPSIVEIGCGTGYYSEVFSTLAGPVSYVGIDYSAAMVAGARKDYPRERFVMADATRLPFRDRSFDIGFSGNSLMHIPDYTAAIMETARIARRWCVFHSVPVVDRRPTTRMRKKAYGVDVFEQTFNTGELESLFHKASLRVRNVREGIAYDLSALLGEHSRLVTFTCEKD